MHLGFELGLDRNAIFTFLHVSDLHFWTEDGASQAFFRAAGVLPFIDGVLGHDRNALLALYRLHDELEAMFPPDRLGLIVTGDLTAWGLDPQFDEADAFFARSLPGPRPLGLRRPGWRQLGIPGNHDHWPGLSILGASNPWLANNFSTPYYRHVQLSTGHRLRFIGLDSDRDVDGLSLSRSLALGQFDTELDAMDQHLNAAPPAIPILLVHHSAQVKGVVTMRIRVRSMHKLMELLSRYRIPVMLTGHAHSTCVERIGFPGHVTLEARCGTTARMDPVSAELAGRLPQATRVPADWLLKRHKTGLLVHQVVVKSGGLHWETRAFERSAVEFEPSSHSGSVKLA